MYSRQETLAHDRMGERKEPTRRARLVRKLAAPSRWRRAELPARAARQRHLPHANQSGVSAVAEALRIGDAASRTRTVTARDIELFTELTGDRNPLHHDRRLARRSRFGGIVVQGGVTSGLLNALVAEDLPGPGSVFLHVDWAFRAPVRPGGRDHRQSGGHLDPGRQAGYHALHHDHQPGRRHGSRRDSRGLARPGSREWLGVALRLRHHPQRSGTESPDLHPVAVPPPGQPPTNRTKASVTKLGDPSQARGSAGGAGYEGLPVRWARGQAARPGGGLPSPGGIRVTWQPSRARACWW
jgi:hypothetical protein